MPLIVQKYGGTSLGDTHKILKIAHHIKATKDKGHSLVVIVSAMGHHTDVLLSQAREFTPTPPRRELDMLLTAGERISTALLAIALDTLKVCCVSLTGSQSGIVTDDNHGNARIEDIKGHRIEEALTKNQVVIVAGFQGVSAKSKDITTLGRGGSDLSAVALAARLKAICCEIYTDVPGVLTADPRLVPEARLIKHLNWDGMLRMAWAGAGVMHHRAGYLAFKYKIPVHMRSSFNIEEEGTMIEGMQSHVSEKPLFSSITLRSGLTFIKVTPNNGSATLWASALSYLWSKGISPVFCRFVPSNASASVHWEVLLPIELLEEFVAQFELTVVSKPFVSCGAISLVGAGFKQSPEVFESLTKICEEHLVPTPYIAFTNEEITMLVEDSMAGSLLKVLHQSFLAH